MKNFLVKDWMTKEVCTAEPKTRMLEAHKLMREKGIRRMPVVRGGKVVGIMTRSDVRSAQPSSATTLNVWEMNYLLAELRVRDVMSKEVVTIRPEDTIKLAAELMHERRRVGPAGGGEMEVAKGARAREGLKEQVGGDGVDDLVS